jgi:hypothetical protein
VANSRLNDRRIAYEKSPGLHIVLSIAIPVSFFCCKRQPMRMISDKRGARFMLIGILTSYGRLQILARVDAGRMSYEHATGNGRWKIGTSQVLRNADTAIQDTDDNTGQTRVKGPADVFSHESRQHTIGRIASGKWRSEDCGNRCKHEP